MDGVTADITVADIMAVGTTVVDIMVVDITVVADTMVVDIMVGADTMAPVALEVVADTMAEAADITVVADTMAVVDTAAGIIDNLLVRSYSYPRTLRIYI